jgi:hypothetical protein
MNEQQSAPEPPASVAVWRDFLRARGVDIDHDRHPVAGGIDADIRADSAIVADLAPLAVVAVRGADATTFLQGQLSNDLGDIGEHGFQLGAYCTPKGRMLATLRVVREADGYTLIAPRATLDKMLPRLRMYVLRAKVTFEPRDDVAIIGINGAAADALGVAAAGPGVQSLEDGALTVVRFDEALPRGLAFGTVDAARRAWDAAGATARECAFPVWRWLEIVNGVPTVWPQTMEEIIPQAANLDLLGAVSFGKGCYPGQEIVARIRYLGKVKQRMVLGHVEDGAAAVEPGVPVYGAGRGSTKAGLVVDAAPAPAGGHDLLAIAPAERDPSARLTLDADGGVVIVERPLPYARPTPD